jgi:hypothetical protein
MLAAAAWEGLGAGAEEALPQPQRESLLADAHRSLEQQRTGERVTPDRVVETAPKRLVTVDWEEGHEGKVRRAGPFRRVVQRACHGHGS